MSATCASKSFDWHLPNPKFRRQSFISTSMPQRTWYVSNALVKLIVISVVTMMFLLILCTLANTKIQLYFEKLLFYGLFQKVGNFSHLTYCFCIHVTAESALLQQHYSKTKCRNNYNYSVFRYAKMFFEA